jgi:hypothetical protein
MLPQWLGITKYEHPVALWMDVIVLEEYSASFSRVDAGDGGNIFL